MLSVEPWVRSRSGRARGLRLAVAVVAVSAVLGGVAAVGTSPAAATPPGGKDVTVTLFEWRFDSVARECTNVLGPKGYGYVEVSPATEHIPGPQWWTSYQPVSYRIAGRLGDGTSFRDMVRACHDAGVKVIADAVINHMSTGDGGGVGTGGSPYSHYTYPGTYADWDFHSCRSPITNYADRYQVQNCELERLADLDTGSSYVRGKIAEYLDSLIAMGVDGFRVDAAKHIPEADLAAVKARLSDPGVFWDQEVIAGAGEAVQPGEYLPTGDVDNFQAAFDLKRVFTGERLAYLGNWGTPWGYLPSDHARPFVDNWDTERNGSTLNHTYGNTYTLANVFLLAWPYGSPQIYSGYEFSDRNAGPPNGGTVDACFAGGWTCQHLWRQIANMVGFRNAVSGTAVTNWWTNDYQAIAFGRGSKGYVAINHESFAVSRTWQTSLPAGTYCDVQHGDRTSSGGCTGPTYRIDSSGRFTADVGAGDAIALYV